MEGSKNIKINEINNYFNDLINSNKPAINYNNSILTYKEVLSKSLSLAFGLKNKYGIKEKDRILIQLDNCPEFIYCYLAALFGGYTIVPIDKSIGTKDFNYIINEIKPKLIIQKKKQLIFSDTYEYIFKTNENDIYAIFFTSGTTGLPKGVCHQISSLFSNAFSFNDKVGFNNDINMFHIMPMGYMAGFLNTILCPLACGGSITIGKRFHFSSVIDFWDDAIKYNANAIWLSPTMVSLLTKLSRDKEKIKWVEENIKYVFVGTAPLSEKIFKSFYNKFGVECLESYGMTEALIISTNIPGNVKINSVGKILSGVKIKEKPFNNKIENKLFVKSKFMFKKYFGKNDNIFESKWFSTGDLGFIDEHDYFFISGREKDLIIRGGINISPTNIENCLLDMEEIDEVVVVGKAHEFWGEEVVAFLKLHKPDTCNIDKIINHCKSLINPESIPSDIIFIDDIPRSSTGKAQKHKLLEML